MTTYTTGRLGRGWAFPPSFSITKGPEMADELDDIRQSLQILFNTLPGERIMRADYGCDLNAYLFENISEDLLADIRRAISDSVLRYEPRVEVLSVVTEQSEQEPTRLRVSLNYRVRGTEDVSQFTGVLDMLNADGGRLR